MNRQQAEHILDAYVRMRMRESDEDASDALREVVLDAMTDYMTSGVAIAPGITLPATPHGTTLLSKPNYERPIVTCRTEVGE